MAKGKRKTQEEFIREAMALHNGFYTYPNVKFIRVDLKVMITCPIHGDFPQSPDHHLSGIYGRGCPHCPQKPRKVSIYTNEMIDEFISNNNILIKRINNYENIDKNMEFSCTQCGKCGLFISFSRILNSKTKLKCNYCRITIMNEEMDAYIQTRNIKRLIRFENMHDKVDWQCLSCNNVWSTRPDAIKENKGCPKCNAKQLTNEDMDLFLIDNNIKIKRIGEYCKAKKKIDWQCLICNNIWPAVPDSIRCGQGCPDCWRGTSSKNEGMVRTFLKENNIETKHFTVKLSVNKNVSTPDFYIPSMNLIIEYNGKQHYQPVRFGGISQKRADAIFDYQTTRDKQLREYCVENNINLLEIDARKYKNFKLIDFLHDYFKINKAA